MWPLPSCIDWLNISSNYKILCLLLSGILYIKKWCLREDTSKGDVVTFTSVGLEN